MMPVRRPPASLLAGYLLFATFMLLESALRQGSEAQSAEAGREDAGTTRMLGTAYGVGLLSMPAFGSIGPRARALGYLGPVVMAAAIALRSWAALVLGRFYTRTLRTAADQHVVRDGPYRLVRHPGYLGTQLLWVGLGLCTQNGLTGALWGAVMFALYRRRIDAEEAMLLRELGNAYAEYMASTPGLIPNLAGLRSA